MAAASSWQVAEAGIPVLSLLPWMWSPEDPRCWLSLPWFEVHIPNMWNHLLVNCASIPPWKIEHFPRWD